MDKELKSLVVEIITLTLLLIVIVPICVNASSKYQEKREVLLNGTDTSIDISQNGDMKKVTIYSNHDDVMRVNLIMKISKISNDYEIYLDDKIYNLDDFECTDGTDYLYYNLGIYEVDQVREFDFKLQTKGSLYYDETITYSFMTAGL